MDYSLNFNQSTDIKTLFYYSLLVLLAIIIIALVMGLVNKARSDNSIFFEDKNAINLRIEKLPDIRIATSHCKDFKVVFDKNAMIISYANPFGHVKAFACELVGEPIEEPFMVKLNETEFKKLCYHLKPGNISVFPNRLRFNYNITVKAKLIYFKKEV